jgi:hypothetical protein
MFDLTFQHNHLPRCPFDHHIRSYGRFGSVKGPQDIGGSGTVAFKILAIELYITMRGHSHCGEHGVFDEFPSFHKDFIKC